MESIQDFFPFRTEDHLYLRETYDLLTLVNQSYLALDIGQFQHITDMKLAIEDVYSVKKRVVEKHCPPDSESLGLAASIHSIEEIDTFERMVSFFHKKKSATGVPWESFIIVDGQLFMKEEAFQNVNSKA